MKKLFIILPLVCLLCFTFGCQKQEKVEWSGTFEEVDGVMVVKNPQEPIYGPEVFNLEDDLTIKNEEGEEEFMFQDILNLVVDNDENIYVCDSKAAHLRVFDKNGGFLRIIGKRGQGSGEMGYPLDIQILPQRKLMVNDIGQLRIHFFSQNGEFLRGLSTSQLTLFMLPDVDSHGNMVACYVIPEDEIKTVLKKFDQDLNPIVTITTQPVISKPPAYEYFELRRSTNLVWDVTLEDDIIWGAITKYEIFVHNPEGKLIKKSSGSMRG